MKNIKKYKSITEKEDCDLTILTKKQNVETDANFNIERRQKVQNW